MNFNDRKWKDMENDEIFSIWSAFLRSEGLGYCDPLRLDHIPQRPMRLSPIEIIKLVNELLDRLEIKEKSNDRQ